jgi:hypothetical protein
MSIGRSAWRHALKNLWSLKARSRTPTGQLTHVKKKEKTVTMDRVFPLSLVSFFFAVFHWGWSRGRTLAEAAAAAVRKQKMKKNIPFSFSPSPYFSFALAEASASHPLKG